MTTEPRTIVLGIGNPCRCDDGAGWAVVERLRTGPAADAAAYQPAGFGGLHLMECMVGYERAFLVDAVVSGAQPGTLMELDCGALGEHLVETCNTASGHDGKLADALRTGAALGLELPAEIRLFGIEAGSMENFAEQLSPAVEAAVAQVTARIEQMLLCGSQA